MQCSGLEISLKHLLLMRTSNSHQTTSPHTILVVHKFQSLIKQKKIINLTYQVVVAVVWYRNKHLLFFSLVLFRERDMIMQHETSCPHQSQCQGPNDATDYWFEYSVTDTSRPASQWTKVTP